MRSFEETTPAAEPGTGAPHRPEHLLRAAEPPVFHDASGRRRRVVAFAGVLAAALTAFWLGAMVVGATGFGTLPSIPRVLALHRGRGTWHGRRVVAASVPASRTALTRVASVAAHPRSAAPAPARPATALDLQ